MSETTGHTDTRFRAHYLRNGEVTKTHATYALALADSFNMGRAGFSFNGITEEPEPHAITLTHVGKTYSGNPKWQWVWDCSCGDGTSGSTKKYIVQSAKWHSKNIVNPTAPRRS